jgi:transposase
MTGRLPMGQKELLRVKILEMVRYGKMTLKAASVLLCVSYRQAIRLYAAYRKEGVQALYTGIMADSQTTELLKQ